MTPVFCNIKVKKNINIYFTFFRLGELSCGYQGSGLVCCPRANTAFVSDETNKVSTPAKYVDGVKCGQSQVEGEGYDGIGAYPWVVRIGFRSK